MASQRLSKSKPKFFRSNAVYCDLALALHTFVLAQGVTAVEHLEVQETGSIKVIGLDDLSFRVSLLPPL